MTEMNRWGSHEMA